MGSVGSPEILMILLVALLVFGPHKLPELGKALGRAVREFKKATSELQETIEREVEDVKRAANDVKRAAEPPEIMPKGALPSPGKPAEKPAPQAAPAEAEPSRHTAPDVGGDAK